MGIKGLELSGNGEDRTWRQPPSGPHAATLLVIVVATLGVLLGMLGYFARSDRDDIKATATAAHAQASSNDKEIAVLKAKWEAIDKRLASIETSQAEILKRLPPVRN